MVLHVLADDEVRRVRRLRHVADALLAQLRDVLRGSGAPGAECQRVQSSQAARCKGKTAPVLQWKGCPSSAQAAQLAKTQQHTYL